MFIDFNWKDWLPKEDDGITSASALNDEEGGGPTNTGIAGGGEAGEGVSTHNLSEAGEGDPSAAGFP